MFHRIRGVYPEPMLGAVLGNGLKELDTHVSERIEISLNANDPFRAWLNSGYQIAFNYLRIRRTISVIKGLSLVSILTGMSAVRNIINLIIGDIKVSSGFSIVIKI